jgi:hypothetical protein
MANILYPTYKQKFLDGTAPNLTAVNIKIVLVDGADYTYNAAHDFLADITGAARVATSANLANKSITGAAFDSDPATFTGVTGDPSEILVMYVDTGSDATSTLIAYYDTATGLTFTPSGTDLTVTPTTNWFAI